MSARRVKLALLIALALAGTACLECCFSDCVDFSPDVALVGSAAATPTGFGVLFLGDGFQSELDLAVYAAAVEQLIRGLGSSATFSQWMPMMNFYKIDVIDPSAQVGDNCEPSLCGVVAMTPAAGASFRPTGAVTPAVDGLDDVLEKDLGVELCWSGTAAKGPCESMWLDVEGREVVFDLAASAPGVDVVVVLANSKSPSGGGLVYSAGGEVGLAVLGLDLDPDDDNLLSETTHLMFEHELGHALGLVDEHLNLIGQAPALPANRNVWKPAREPWSPSPADPDCVPIPWADLLQPGCESRLMKPCCSFPHSGAFTDCAGVSAACPWEPADPGTCADGACAAACAGEVCASTACASAPCGYAWISGSCGHALGAREGAYYSPTGYYRAAPNCRMRELDAGVGFCEACARVLTLTFCASDADCPSIPESPCN